MKKILISTAILICSLFVISNFPLRADDLVINGQPRSQIVIAAQVSSTEKYVAKDLQRVIRKISSATLPITNNISKSTFNIVIGTPRDIPEIKSAGVLQDDNPETVRVVTQGKVLFLAGNTPGSALRAVYTFLQEQLNCRWYWPGESGEYLPAQKNISIADLNVTETPSIRYRSLAIDGPHWDEDTLVWMSRNRMNLYNLDQWRMTNERIAEMHEKGFQATLGGHSIVLPETILKEHPEYRALYGNKRQGEQLCWGNPEVQNAVAEEIKAWWKKYPDLDSIQFLAADTTEYCNDKLCQALAPDVSTRWQKFCQIVIDKVRKDYPDKHYWTLAYQGYGKVPTKAASSFDFISYAVMQQDYTKPIASPANNSERQIIENWQKVSGNIALRGYQFIPFSEALYTPFMPILLQDISWAHQKGLQGWYSELTPYGFPQDKPLQDQHWTANRLSLYAAAAALWNADIDETTLTHDWTGHVFGPAAKPMANYYAVMQRAWANSSKPLRNFNNTPAAFVGNFISVEILITANQYLAEARNDAEKISDANYKASVLQQINLEAAMLNNWRKVLLLQRGLLDRFTAKAPHATVTPQMTAAPNDLAWKDISPLPVLENTNLQPAENPSKVLLQWDQNALYLRLMNQGNIPNDAIKVLLADPQNQTNYHQIVIDAGNKVTADNSHIISKTSAGKNGWILDVKLPFQEFGITPQNGAVWNISVKRAGAGWPDASPNNPLAFGAVELVDKIIPPQRVAFYNGAGAPNDALLVTFRIAGFDAQSVTKSDLEKSTFAKNADAIVLNALTPQDAESLDNAMKNVIVPFVKSGGLLLITGHSNIPLENWFGVDAAMGWTDVVAENSQRKSTFVAKGKWITSPNDLSKIVETVTTPRFGYRPTSEKWEALAKVRMKDGEDSDYLMRQEFGKGRIIVTSSDFGYQGGWEMFGDRRIQNAPKLMENLLK
jgi:hypothetical protein